MGPIYAFSEKYSVFLDEGCRSLAIAVAKDGTDVEAVALNHLSNLIKTLGEHVDEIGGVLEDKTDGFSRLGSLLCAHFFGKIPPVHFSDIVNILGGWSFKDIAGTIPSHEGLWDDAVRNQDPAAPNIKDLMSRPEDNEMKRVY